MLRLGLVLRTSAAPAAAAAVAPAAKLTLAAALPYAVPVAAPIKHRGMGMLFVPDSAATLEKLADDYVNLPAATLVALHKRVSDKLKVDHEAQLLAQCGGGGGGASYAVAAPAAAAGGDAAPAEAEAPKAAEPAKKKVEKTTADVKLVKFPAEAKIKLIKELRAVTNLPLKDAKDAIDKAPGLIQTNMSKDDAEKLKKLFEGLGAEVELL